jgi:predicted adenylyl cyclase CyaB
VIVDKTREIYFIDNIKIHLDFIEDIGCFVEIEARDENETIGIEFLTKQCQDLLKEFNIDSTQLICNSYSDMLLAKVEKSPVTSVS